MNPRHSILFACLFILMTSCSSLSSNPLYEWRVFIDKIAQLEQPSLQNEIQRLIEQSQAIATTDIAPKDVATTDKVQLQLAYLLSRPNTAEMDLDLSISLLAGISPDSPYSPLAALLSNEIMLQKKLREKIQEKPPLIHWNAFINELENLDQEALEQKKQNLTVQMACCPTDETALHLGYLLSGLASNTAKHSADQSKSRTMLEKIARKKMPDRQGEYSFIATIILEKMALNTQIDTKTRQLDELNKQLETLKGIDEVMNENQRTLDEALSK